jgi:hypothetical protein
MSKKTTETTENKQPAFVEELLKNGTVTITSLTREGFDSMLKDIPEGVKYIVGAVGHNPETGVFTLRVDINP